MKAGRGRVREWPLDALHIKVKFEVLLALSLGRQAFSDKLRLGTRSGGHSKSSSTGQESTNLYDGI